MNPILITEKEILKQSCGVFKNAFLAGGALTSMFTNHPISDYDIYFKSKEAFLYELDGAYDSGYWCLSLSERAITFRDNGGSIYQFMFFNFFESAQDIFKSFDFTCNMAALDFDKDEIVMDDRFLVDASKRQLVFNHNTAFPLASGMRVLKYQGKGYTIQKREMLKLLATISFLNVNDWEGLKNQIGGAYGDEVALDTAKPFDLDGAISSIHGAFSASEIAPKKPVKDVPATYQQAQQMIFGNAEKTND